jgi:superfamily II DNA/RNA helicase
MTNSSGLQNPELSRDDLAAEYFERLLYPPYPVQEEALFAWFSSEQGVLVCAPTGTGKTLIAEAAVYEALRTGKRMYYTTPLIALTDQKLLELQKSAVRWGFPESAVGLVTGNRRVNPDAPVLVVVAEILLNRLLNPDAFDFKDVSSVVMDEFHSFNDPERGIVWELTLGQLPPHVRTLLLSATVGNSVEFNMWLTRAHQRNLILVQSQERKVPLSFWWVDDKLLDEFMEEIAEGDEIKRRTPALIFCFNRDQCWQVAELLKGKRMIDKARQAALVTRLDAYDWSEGAGPKLRQILMRGVGVHHAGILPRYRRIVEDLFQEKLLSVAVCTETLSAGINLPARSVVLPTILKGPVDNRKMIEPSTAQQIFGRAGRPQFDNEGFVFALAHEDDVKILRWKEKYDSIPEDTKDPGLMQAKKQLKKKKPTRRQGETYWTADQFEKLRTAPSAKLASRGQLPWRLLAYLLSRSPEVQPLRDLVGRRLMDSKQLEVAQRELNQMLITLWTAGYVELDPKPQPRSAASTAGGGKGDGKSGESSAKTSELVGLLAAAGYKVSAPPPANKGDSADDADDEQADGESKLSLASEQASRGYDLENYRPLTATPTERLDLLVRLRSINPLYGVFLAGHLAIADQNERLQVLESVLELPNNIAKLVRVPPEDELPQGPLALDRLNHQLLELGLAGAEELGAVVEEESEAEEYRRGGGRYSEPPPRPLTIAQKVKRMFDYDFPQVHDVYCRPVWVAGEVLEFGGNFNKYITARGLQKQEGMIFRHLLRLILLLDEMASIPPPETEPEQWEDPLDDLIQRLTETCRAVDPSSTDEMLQKERGGDDLLAGFRELKRKK